MRVIADAMNEIENTTTTIEQLRDVVLILRDRYFQDKLSNNTAKFLFANEQPRMRNIINLVETQLD